MYRKNDRKVDDKWRKGVRVAQSRPAIVGQTSTTTTLTGKELDQEFEADLSLRVRLAIPTAIDKKTRWLKCVILGRLHVLFTKYLWDEYGRDYLSNGQVNLKSTDTEI